MPAASTFTQAIIPLTYFKTSCKLNATCERWVNDFVNAPFDGAVNQSNNNKTCVPAVNQISANISELNISYNMILEKNQWFSHIRLFLMIK